MYIGAGAGKGEGKELRPEGYRASADDVFAFTSTPSSTQSPSPTGTSADSAITAQVPERERTAIPLSPTYTATSGSSVRTPPTYPLTFPLPPPLPRSPFRLAPPPPTRTSRLRPIANPLLLRLRALENAYGALMGNGAGGEGWGVKEKIVGVAWEGIGRSGLVREVKPSTMQGQPTKPKYQSQYYYGGGYGCGYGRM